MNSWSCRIAVHTSEVSDSNLDSKLCIVILELVQSIIDIQSRSDKHFTLVIIDDSFEQSF